MENDKFVIPKGFVPARRSPPFSELEALYIWLCKNYKGKVTNVLEFGCGVTSVVLSQSLNPSRYVCVEQFQPCIDMVKKIFTVNRDNNYRLE